MSKVELQKSSPSAAEEIICRNCCLQVRMTDLTKSTDSICFINSKHNYIGISTIPPDSAAITGYLNRLCIMKPKPQLFNRGCEHGEMLMQY